MEVAMELFDLLREEMTRQVTVAPKTHAHANAELCPPHPHTIIMYHPTRSEAPQATRHGDKAGSSNAASGTDSLAQCQSGPHFEPPGMPWGRASKSTGGFASPEPKRNLARIEE